MVIQGLVEIYKPLPTTPQPEKMTNVETSLPTELMLSK